jgi:hypothetical protein
MFNGKKPDRDLQGVEMLWNKVAGGLGVEPRLAESESAVLPLDDRGSARFERHCVPIPGLSVDLI